MKALHIACIGLVVLAVLVTGCTSQPPQPPASPVVTTAPTASVTPAVAVPASLTSTTWKLAWFDDTRGVWSKVAEGSTITATFLNEGRITGSGGCNGYSADYQLGNESRIFIRRPEVPGRLCQFPTGVMSQESVYFTDLMAADTYSITNGQLLIFNKENRTVLQFEPL